MIVGYYGNVRQGKTYGAVIELFILYLKGRVIYSNTWLWFPYKELTLNYLLDIVEQDLDIEDDAVFFIDEIPVWLDSRCSMGKRNRIMSYFLAQTGKLGKNTDYGLTLLFTAQYSDMVDKRLRHFTDKACESEKFEIRGEKFFLQTIHVYRGKKSYTYNKVIKGHAALYSLYNTRKKIKYEQDRYSKEAQELIVSVA